MGVHGSIASGMQSSAFTPASAVAAVFAATGQDLGMVGTSSMAHGTINPAAGGGVHVSLRLAGVEVGVLGGGTTLPYARTWLEVLGCRGQGGAFRLAQIVAAAALCLDVSAVASMATAGSANFVEAHHARGGLR
jgi:hydroxymethylglutaryl-CoA reductase (NADPH)